MKRVKALDSWHRTKLGFFIFGCIELGIAYGFASLAIDRGNLGWYFLALVFFIGGLRNIFQLIRVFMYGKHQAI